MRLLFALIALSVVVAAPISNASAAVDEPLPPPSSQPTAPPSPSLSVMVPRATPVRVSIVDELDGYRNLAGSKIHFDVLDPVIVDGVTIIAKGDVGVGTIQDGGHGPLKISVDEIYNFCGDSVDMLFTFSAADRRRAWSGHAPSQIHKGAVFTAETLHVQKVCAKKV